MILLQILKIIGIILLIILAVIVVLLLLILFCPIRYRVKGFYKESYQVEAKVSWLLHIISFSFSKDNNRQQILLRIFGIPKELSKEKKEKPGKNQKNKKNKKDKKKTAKKEEVSEEDFFDLPVEDKKEKIEENPQAKEADHIETQSTKVETNEKHKATEHKIKNRKSIKNKFISIRDKVKGFFGKIKTMIHNIFGTWQKISRIWEEEAYYEAFSHVKKEVFYLLKKIMPSRMKLEATYSCGSPDLTGQVLGILALFPMGYQNKWRIYPDFEAEEFYVQSEFDVKGHIFVFQIVGIAIRLLFDKNCKKVWKDFHK